MADVSDVVVPDIGDFTDVPIIEILVSVGDEIEPEQPLVTLESDKATMDVPAPFGGVVEQLKVKVGDRVSEGTPLLSISVDGAAPEEAEAQVVPSTDGAGGPDVPATGATQPSEGEPEPAGAEPPAAGGETPAEPAKPTEPATAPGAPVYAGPGARRRARELGIDLTGLTGRGRKGRILVEDVEAAQGQPSGAPGAGLELAPWPQVDFAEFGPVEVQPLSRIKKIAGPNLQRNWVVIPHVTQHDEADITDLEAFRKRANEELASQEVKLTMVALLLKASAAALREYPQFNASLEGENLVLKGYYHLGFATDTPGGLLVPVIRDVDRKGLADIARELRELSEKARAGKLSPAEMKGGTFTISSLGGIGGTAFTPIVNAPEVAILGVSRSQMKPVGNGSEFVPRLMLPLSLSYDHRVIDGAAAARFTSFLASVLADMRRVLL